MTGRFLINDPTEKMGVGRASLIQSLNKMLKTNKKKQKQRSLQFYESSSCCQTLHLSSCIFLQY